MNGEPLRLTHSISTLTRFFSHFMQKPKPAQRVPERGWSFRRIPIVANYKYLVLICNWDGSSSTQISLKINSIFQMDLMLWTIKHLFSKITLLNHSFVFPDLTPTMLFAYDGNFPSQMLGRRWKGGRKCEYHHVKEGHEMNRICMNIIKLFSFFLKRV